MLFFVQFLTLACALWIGLIFIIVLLNALNRDPSNQGETMSRTVQQFARTLVFSIIAIGTAIVVAFIAIFNHIFKFWYLYILFILGSAVAAGWAEYHPEVLNGVDEGFSRFYASNVADIILFVANTIRILYNFYIAIIWNWLAGSLRIIVNTFIDILINCESQNWEETVFFLLKSGETGIIATSNFLLSVGLDELELNQTFNYVGLFVGSFKNAFDCECQDLDFFWNLIKRTVENPHLSA
ncbi:MAG: hypothetical protein MUO21_02110, partial [Nitrososphaeraceae archaeon]|nr:hypothetical protein [Nitrososphaeraceae archaeon]